MSVKSNNIKVNSNILGIIEITTHLGNLEYGHINNKMEEKKWIETVPLKVRCIFFTRAQSRAVPRFDLHLLCTVLDE